MDKNGIRISMKSEVDRKDSFMVIADNDDMSERSIAEHEKFKRRLKIQTSTIDDNDS